MKIGFTGTQVGMTDQQRTQLSAFLRAVGGGDELHHGDCVGADAQAHDEAEAAGYETISHPPINNSKRAWKKATRTMEPADYLVRNKNIVRAADILIATPQQDYEIMRSGTWSTVRFARKLGKKIFVIMPDGSVKTERDHIELKESASATTPCPDHQRGRDEQ